MKGRRLKNYRKQMQVFKVNFGFREPYQVVCDAQILEDAWRMKIDLPDRIKGILGGEVKMMITQCCIRQLYDAKPKNDALINAAKGFERRRCGHHELETPLDDDECLLSVLGPTNKHRLVIATQDAKTRSSMRRVPGTPIIYISKSVVILEPISSSTEAARDQEEKAKFRTGLKGRGHAETGQKRKRSDDKDDEGDDSQAESDGSNGEEATDARPVQKKKRARGPKQPNPLSMKKSKKAAEPQTKRSTPAKPRGDQTVDGSAPEGTEAGKRKRRRKHKSKVEGEGEDIATEQVTTSP